MTMLISNFLDAPEAFAMIKESNIVIFNEQ